MSDRLDSTTVPKSIGELTENIVDRLRENKDAQRSALLDLEDQICCLHSMSLISDYLLDAFVVDFETKSSRANDSYIQPKLTDYEMNMLTFAWKDLTRRTHTLQHSFYAAVGGEDKP